MSSISHQAHGKVFPNRGCGLDKGIELHAIVLGVEQTAELGGACLYPARHLRLGNVLRGHFMLDLKRDGPFDGRGNHVVMNAFVAQRAFEGLADPGVLVHGFVPSSCEQWLFLVPYRELFASS